MEKRYQVFVSSTYTDLIEERSEVMQALLELNCMPAGMELFPAANETQWEWIKKVIDESDYYIVIIGGRYGTISESTGVSYTEMEYRYAVDIGKPVIGFLHEDPLKLIAGKFEKDPTNLEKLDVFKKDVQKRLCKYWSSASDLGAKVSRSITQLMKQFPAVGWVRADIISNENNAEEVLKLKRKIELLESELDTVRTVKPKGTELLAGGTDLFSIKYYYRRKKSREGTDGRKSWYIFGDETSQINLTWDVIFGYLAISFVEGIERDRFVNYLNNMIGQFASNKLEHEFPDDRFIEFEIDENYQDIILIQLRALKLITVEGNVWKLTPYGDNYMATLLAVHKK